MITELTDAQKAKFPEYVKKWLDIGYSTSDIDKDAIIKNLNEFCGEELKDYIWCGSPMANIIVAILYTEKNIKCFFQSKDQNMSWPELDALAQKHFTKQELDTKVNEHINKCIFGQHDAAWLSFYDYMQRELSIDLDKRVNNLFALAETSNWIVAVNNIAFVSRKPVYVHTLDDQGRAHREDGPYIQYPDGFCVFCWHGTAVPRKWLMEKNEKLTAQIAITHDNIEERRAACEIIGWDQILSELNARVIDEDGDPEIGTLLEVELPDVGTEKFLQVRCGTGRTFALPVPPEMESALEAQSWTWGIDKVDFTKPEVRT